MCPEAKLLKTIFENFKKQFFLSRKLSKRFFTASHNIIDHNTQKNFEPFVSNRIKKLQPLSGTEQNSREVLSHQHLNCQEEHFEQSSLENS